MPRLRPSLVRTNVCRPSLRLPYLLLSLFSSVPIVLSYPHSFTLSASPGLGCMQVNSQMSSKYPQSTSLPLCTSISHSLLFYANLSTMSSVRNFAQRYRGVQATDAESRSRLAWVLARSNAVHFGRKVKSCVQNDPGLPVVGDFQQQVRKSMCAATAWSLKEEEGPLAVLFLQLRHCVTQYGPAFVSES